MADSQEAQSVRNRRDGSAAADLADAELDSSASPRPSPVPVHRYSYPLLLVVPVLLSAGYLAAVVVFSLHDVNPGLLYSQCHARAKVPWLSHVPLIGAPACYLVSFFQYAAASWRSSAVLTEILSLAGGLLTVTTLEAGRLCNASDSLIANPTGPWLIFNLAGGQLVWGLVVVPAFLRRAKALEAVETSGEAQLAADSRNLTLGAEAVAVPVAVAVGFLVPSLAMLISRSSVAVFVWLFFPIYVAFTRQLVRWVLVRADAERFAPSYRVEKSRRSAAWLYAPAVVFSVLAHAALIGSLFMADDRKEMTRSCIFFLQIDALFIGLTALYWVLVEGGWKAAGLGVVVSVVLGPGAGVCAAWLLREWTAHGIALGHGEDGAGEEATRGDGDANEQTPLLSG